MYPAYLTFPPDVERYEPALLGSAGGDALGMRGRGDASETERSNMAGPLGEAGMSRAEYERGRW